MKNPIYVILGLCCVLCLNSGLKAQDAGTLDKPKVEKKNRPGKKKKMAVINKLFKGAELTQEQKDQLAELLDAKKEELMAIRTRLAELINKEDAKSIKAAARKGVLEGLSKAEAQKQAWGEIGLTTEVQNEISTLHTQRMEIEQEVVTQMVATFSEEQKAAMKTDGKGKKGKGKGKKGKRKKDNE